MFARPRRGSPRRPRQGDLQFAGAAGPGVLTRALHAGRDAPMARSAPALPTHAPQHGSPAREPHPRGRCRTVRATWGGGPNPVGLIGVGASLPSPRAGGWHRPSIGNAAIPEAQGFPGRGPWGPVAYRPRGQRYAASSRGWPSTRRGPPLEAPAGGGGRRPGGSNGALPTTLSEFKALRRYARATSRFPLRPPSLLPALSPCGV